MNVNSRIFRLGNISSKFLQLVLVYLHMSTFNVQKYLRTMGALREQCFTSLSSLDKYVIQLNVGRNPIK